MERVRRIRVARVELAVQSWRDSSRCAPLTSGRSCERQGREHPTYGLSTTTFVFIRQQSDEKYFERIARR
jgi:hypothetical protein